LAFVLLRAPGYEARMNPTHPNDKRLTRRAAPADAGMRLDQFWVRELADSGLSRERIKEWIQQGLAGVDGKPCVKPGQRLDGREALVLDAPDLSTDTTPEAEAGPLDILHRDQTLAVVVKPAGLTTHPAPSQPAGTLVNRLLAHFPELAPEVSGMTGERPGIVHRLDKDTSGVMLVALTEAARLELSEAFADRRVRKTYLALAHGRPKGDEAGPLGPDAGCIDLPMGRHPSIRTKMAVLKKGGREARTSWRRLWTDRRGLASLIAVDLHTGRTHQIRVHMAHIGHPLLGDPVYGPARHAAWLKQAGPLAELAPRQMLHAFRLAFEHPESGEELAFTQPPPEDFLALVRTLASDCQRVVVTGMPGCGKSALLAALARRGAPVFSADACVAALYAPDGPGTQQLARILGRGILAPDGGVDRRRLLSLLLERPAARREVEDAIHPMVGHEMAAFFEANAHRDLAVAEVPLYFESGWSGGKGGKGPRGADVTVGLRTPEALRHGALRESRGIAPEVLAAFESWQWPEERKLAACDLVVENSGSLTDLDRAAEDLLDRLARLRAERLARFEAELGRLLDAVASEGALKDSPGHGPDRGAADEDPDDDEWADVEWEVTAE
jgi:23S rRNA pseudouridine1911/1915/1917 synthase